MVFSRASRPIVAVLAIMGLLATSLMIARGTTVQAASRTSPSALKPIILVVDSHIAATNLTTSTALQRGGAALGLPLTLLAPTSIPTTTQLYSLNIERPLHGYTAGVATLGFAQTATGQYTFQIDEAPVPFFFGRAKQSATTINGHPGIVYDLGATGSNHLIAITWSLGNYLFYDITSNVGKSKLTTSTMLKIASSIPLQVIPSISTSALTSAP